MCKTLLPKFSFTSFMVSGPTFRSWIHFECIFVYGERRWLSFTLLHVAVQFPHHHLLKRLSFPHCIFFLLCCRLIDHVCVGLFLGSLSCSIDWCVYFSVSTILGLISKIYQELIQLNTKRIIQLENGQRTWRDIFQKKTYRWPTNICKDAQHH